MKDKSVNKLEEEIRDYFSSLSQYAGERITLEYVEGGKLYKQKTTLRKVNDFVNVEIDGAGIPFIGHSCAIKRILGNYGKILYKNPLISEDYNIGIGDEELYTLKALSFGKDIAEKMCKTV